MITHKTLFRGYTVCRGALVKRTTVAFFLAIVVGMFTNCSREDKEDINSNHISDIDYYSWAMGAAYEGYFQGCWTIPKLSYAQSTGTNDFLSDLFKENSMVTITSDRLYVSVMPYDFVITISLPEEQAAEAIASLDNDARKLGIQYSLVKGYTDQTIYFKLELKSVWLRLSYGGTLHEMELRFSEDSQAYYDTKKQLFTILLCLSQVVIDGEVVRTFNPELNLLFSTINKSN